MLPILARALAVLALLVTFGASAAAQSAKTPDDASPRVRMLLDLLADPEVRAWLEKRAADKPKPAPSSSDVLQSVVVSAASTSGVECTCSTSLRASAWISSG